MCLYSLLFCHFRHLIKETWAGDERFWTKTRNGPKTSGDFYETVQIPHQLLESDVVLFLNP